MHFNYSPPDGIAADFIPFFWEGAYHLFYLKDFRNIPAQGEGTPWCHLVTHDFVHFVDHGECLPRGSVDEQDLYVFTGSVLHGAGQFHIFYTGHNPHLRRAGKPEQAIMHAVSDDLFSWRKAPEDTFFAPAEGYEPHDWRDPFVFWNEEAGEYWMLIAARLTAGPSRRRGITGLCTSPDLKSWTVREPFYAPHLYFTHECPDLFRLGDWWYLVFSEFSDACVTRYRMARSLEGPWLTPRVDTFDGRAFYAAKTAGGGAQRFLFGWNPTRVGEKDYAPWQWGGNLVVHEIVQETDGALSVRLPQTVAGAFGPPAAATFADGFGWWEVEADSLRLASPGRFSCAAAGELPPVCLIRARFDIGQGTEACGIMLRTDASFETGYYVRLEPQRGRLVFDAWPRPGDMPHMVELERPLDIAGTQPLQLTLYVNGSICEVYVNDRIAMSARMYDHAAGAWGVFAQNGAVEATGVTICRRQDEA